MTIYFGRIRMYKQKKQWIRQDKYFGQMVSCTNKGNKSMKEKKKRQKRGPYIWIKSSFTIKGNEQ